ncbi:MAG TPA: hypothetical protein VGL81_36565 [Polyangiaceae bacterium]
MTVARHHACRVRRLVRSSSLFAGAMLVLLAVSGGTTRAQQPAQPQRCVNVMPPFRQNGSQLQQAVAAGSNVSVPVPVAVASAPQITIGPTTLVGSEVAQVKQIIPSTNPSFVFVVVDLAHAHAVGEVVWPTWQGSFCAPACAPGTNAFPQCLPACPALTPCILPSVPGVPSAPPIVPPVPSIPSLPTPPAQGAGAWVAFNGGWAMTVPPFVNPVPVPPLPWSSASPPPPQATVFSQASATPGAIPSPTPSGPVVYVPSGGRWVMVPSGSWTGAATVIVPVLPPVQFPSIPH